MPVMTDWYFDIISPFAYLQHRQLRTINRQTAFRAHPVLFAGLLNHWGQKGPAEIPAKRTFTYKHVMWLAQHSGVRLNFPQMSLAGGF